MSDPRVRILCGLLVLVGVGSTAGLVVARWDALRPPSETRLLAPATDADGETDLPPLPPPGVAPPVVVVDHDRFDFGEMEPGAKGSHTFVIRNEGGWPLSLRKGPTTCKCTLSGIDDDEIPPGGSGTVTLEWTAKAERPVFEQSATILTNDPGQRRVRLHIYGRLVSSFDLSPGRLAFNKRSEADQQYEVIWSSSRFDDFEPTGYECSDPATAEFLEVSFAPLSAVELANNPLPSGVKSGWRVGLHVKPGLPVGPFQQTILLAHDRPQVPPVELPVGGLITGDISIAAAGWDERSGVLDLGAIEGGRAVQRKLNILVRGEGHEQAEMRVEAVSPDWLQVAIGDTLTLPSGRVSQVPVTITIPADRGPAAYLGGQEGTYGELRLTTNLPKTPHTRLWLRFAISQAP